MLKIITRVLAKGTDNERHFYLDQDGKWIRNAEFAFQFEEAEANKRVRRIPHALIEDAPP